ncbi:protein-L-isoaspartate(D-aspartate) O-methyltransferase [Thermoflavifilum thermophilum]|uniref:Protein-L-isoaspartate O-methyltransferase n=1 Tax=Thermoflavifilum thermophilum TaxID=1393122 RepID=A0A1I7NJD4_9BACT|nr:protein-L-isoaspartate(D-aspartate) O-methyltransferase [Thermoflavifilum thermophilum]SFV34686.1 protein-L-isoaspartate(D-aspartate) O-methyltransferase [Thermoflavifilum thermophilum]
MRNYEDSYRHKGLRKKLVDSLRRKGITDESVLEAMQAVPRHFFMDTALESFAYEDRAFPIGEGQTISQPYTVAYQTQLLQVKPHDKILEIGTGSGYQACILAEMGAHVYTIERQRKLFERLKTFPFLSRYPTIHFFYGDGYEGLPTFAPFDKIIVTAAAPYIPEKLMDQLKIGGMMVIPIGGREGQRMYRITKVDDQKFEQEMFDNFSFVPMVSGKK